jgi:hypothetical protein
LPFGLGGKQISKPLRFVKIDPPIGKCAPGKLAWFSAPQTSNSPQCYLHCAHHCASTVQVQLHQIITGGGRRAREDKHQSFVENMAVSITQGAQRCPPWQW